MILLRRIAHIVDMVVANTDINTERRLEFSSCQRGQASQRHAHEYDHQRLRNQDQESIDEFNRTPATGVHGWKWDCSKG